MPRSLHILLITVALALVTASNAAAVSLTGVRYSSNAERTRVVLDLDAPATYTRRALSDPARVVVEIDKSKLGSQVAPVSVGDGYVHRVRLNQLSDGRVQVVLDLVRALDYDVLVLTKPNRLVVDVKHQGKPAPADPQPKPAGNAPTAGAGTGSEAASPAPSIPVPVPAVPPHRDHWVVAVDAGHGGKDPGAQGHGTDEKDIAFALAREVVAELNRRPGIRAFPVRAGNYFIPLARRRGIAEKDSADIFVSIHCNASEKKAARGTEVYFLSLKGASDEAAKEVAKFENEADTRMGLEAEAPELDQILFDMIQADVLVKSQMLAETCLEKLFGLGTVYDRGVKQAGFVVLKSPRIPSVLVEAAFITNREENKLLKSGKWQGDFGRLLADGVEDYLRGIERAEHTAQP
jgi:N-acetylmuramoyl-L-alanine amidase